MRGRRSSPLVLATFVATSLVARASPAQRPAPDAAQRRAACRDSVARTDTTNAALARCSARLAAVTVVSTAARRAEPLSAVSVPLVLVEQTPALNAWDLLRQTAGVEVHDQGQGPGFASDMSVRGFSSDHSTDLALWIDGVPINEPVNGHAEGYNDFSLLFPQAISDLDVIKGPTSALFGNFALSGVVNVRTLERVAGTQLLASGGSFGHGDASVLTGFDHGAVGSGVLGVRVLHDEGWRPNSASDLAQVHARVVHDVSSSATIDGGMELYGARWNSPGYLGEAEFAARRYDIVSNPSDGGYKRRAQERVSLRVISGSMLWRTTAYATQGRWQLFLTIPPAGGQFEGSGSQTEEEDTRYGFGLTSALTWVLPRAEVTIGTEGRYDHADFENWLTTRRTRDSASVIVRGRQASGALFVQSAVDATDALRLTLGARVDEADTRSSLQHAGAAAMSARHSAVSPKLGALLAVARGVALYGNVSRGFRQSDGVITDPTRGFITAWAYEGGIKLDHPRGAASLALFRMDVSNEETFNPLSSGSSRGGASRRQGAEASLRVPLAGLFAISADWTFNDARYRNFVVRNEDDPSKADTLSGLRVFNTAKYVGIAALEWARPASEHRVAWRARVAGNWVGPYSPFDEPGVVIPAYGLLHVGGGATLGRASVDVGVRNAFDRPYPELVAGHIVAPGQTRAIYGSLRYAF
ncbi:MAG: TonB-dependent receptor [Gemmatimonadaceae bacterium]